MLRVKILRMDGSILADDVEVQGQDARRGTGDGHVWRGSFSAFSVQAPPSLGETLVIAVADDRAMIAVVTMVGDSRIHFRAPGRMPVAAMTAMSAETE